MNHQWCYLKPLMDNEKLSHPYRESHKTDSLCTSRTNGDSIKLCELERIIYISEAGPKGELSCGSKLSVKSREQPTELVQWREDVHIVTGRHFKERRAGDAPSYM